MKRISVIVPIYNAEKYLSRCLDSILMQSNADVELILINDGSTDKSEEIINTYLGRYKSSIKYIKTKNSGVANARNLGLDKATGDYIIFVDADDYIDKNLFKNLKQYMDKNIDIIKYKAILETEEEEKIGVLEGPNNFFFKEGFYHEDFGLIPLIILKANTFISTDIQGYHYVQSKNSLMRSTNYEKNVKKIFDTLIQYDNMIEKINTYKISKKAKEDTKIFYTNSILLRVNDLNKKDRKKFIKEIRKRKMTKNIKIRNPKQLIKRIILRINIPLYLKMR